MTEIRLNHDTILSRKDLETIVFSTSVAVPDDC